MFLLWSDRLTFIALCLLIFVLPATIGGVSIFMVAAIVFFLAGRAASIAMSVTQKSCWWKALRGQAGRAWLSLPLAFFVGINFLSMLWSEHPQPSRKAFFSKVLGHVLIYLAARDAINNPHRIRILVNVFFASAAIICLDAIYQLNIGHSFFKHSSVVIEGRASAAFNHPNGLAAYLVLALPLMFGMVVMAWQQWRKNKTGTGPGMTLACAAGFLLGMVALGLTYSRGAWLGFLVAVASSLLLDRTRKALFLAAVAVLAFIVFVPMLKAQRNVSLVAENLPAASNVPREQTVAASASREDAKPLLLPAGETQTVNSNDWLDKLYIKFVRTGIGGSDRLIYWRDAMKIIRDHPWTGTGLNTYAKTIKDYNMDRPLYAHNSYLQLTAELGLFGLLVFLWLIVAHLYSGGRALAIMGPDMAFLWSLILAGFMGFLTNAFLENTFYSVQHGTLLWFFLGLIAAGRSIANGQKESICR